MHSAICFLPGVPTTYTEIAIVIAHMDQPPSTTPPRHVASLCQVSGGAL